MNQDNYINGLQLIEMPQQESAQPKEKDVDELNSLAGQLNWIASQTRPKACKFICSFQALKRYVMQN